jgi:hypothetical protein
MTTLAQKLQLKPNQPLKVANAPSGYQGYLVTELPDNLVSMLEGDRPVEALLLFVNNLEEAGVLAPQLFAGMDPDGLVWLAYPKGSSKVVTDVNRDILWEALKPTGWRPVRQVSLDETWSAMRFRPADRVGGRR